MQAKQQLSTHSKILPAKIGRVDVLKKSLCMTMMYASVIKPTPENCVGLPTDSVVN